MNDLRTAELRQVLADLPYLLAVAATGGVTAAADDLAVPQPTVSRGLARLAGHLGVPVLARSGRGVELSAEAAELLPHAGRALAAVSAGVEAARRLAAERANTATVTFQHTLGRTVVPALVRAVLEGRPGTHFELRQGSREVCVDALEAGSADVVLLAPAYPGGAGVETVKLYAEPLMLVVPAGHRLARRRSVRVTDLAGERLLVTRPESGLRGLVDELLAGAGLDVDLAFEGEDVQTLRGLAAAGLGVAILPPAIPAASDVIEVPLADPGAVREIGVSWRTDRASTPAADALHDVVRGGRGWLPRVPGPASHGAAGQASG
jgi:DNA-binding transcriptional LysR family regulator